MFYTRYTVKKLYYPFMLPAVTKHAKRKKKTYHTCIYSSIQQGYLDKTSGRGRRHTSRESGVRTRNQLDLTVSKISFLVFPFCHFFVSFPFPRYYICTAFYSPARAVPPVPVYSPRCPAQSSLCRWSLHSTPTTADRR